MNILSKMSELIIGFHYQLNLNSNNKGMYEGPIFRNNNYTLKTELMFFDYEKLGLMFFDISPFDIYIDWLTS